MFPLVIEMPDWSIRVVEMFARRNTVCNNVGW